MGRAQPRAPIPPRRAASRARCCRRVLPALVVLLGACDPYARWPDPSHVFPWVHTRETGLEPYEEIRFETDTWEPLVDTYETALYVIKSFEHRTGAPPETLLHFGSSRPPPIVEGHPLLSFVGDLMVMEDAAPSYAADVAPLLDGALRIGNLETPVSPIHPTDPAELVAEYGLYAFNAPLSILDALPLDVLQLNNNHTLDLGDEGFEQTYKSVSGRGYVPIGYGDNQARAVLGELDVGLLSYTWGINGAPQSRHDLAVVPFGHLVHGLDMDRIRDEIAQLRADGVSHVVLLLHWGFEYEYWPDPHFMRLARRLVRYGADVVVGHGPHVAQPAELCAVNQPLAIPGIGQCSVRSDDGEQRTAAVLYSLGNFGTDLGGLPLEVGLVGSVSLDPRGGVSGLGYEAVARVRSDAGVVLAPLEALAADEVEGEAYAEEAARLDRLLGTSWKRSR